MADVKISALPNGDGQITGSQGRVDVPVTIGGVTYQVDIAALVQVPPVGVTPFGCVLFTTDGGLVTSNANLDFESDILSGTGTLLTVNTQAASSGDAQVQIAAGGTGFSALGVTGGSGGCFATFDDTPFAALPTVMSNTVTHALLGVTPSGRTLPSYIDTNHQRLSYLQFSEFSDKTMYRWFPNDSATGGRWTGMATPTSSGTIAYTLPTTTNRWTAQARQTYKTVVTTLNQDVGMQGTNFQFWRGDGTNGGFFYHCRFGIESYTAGDRFFVGFSATSNVCGTDPSSGTNILAFAVDAADSAFSFMHNDNAGGATKTAIAGQPALAANNAYDAYIYCDKTNTSAVYFRLDNYLTGANIIDSNVTTDLPVNTTMLLPNQKCGNAANAAAAAAGIGILRAYIEID